MQTIDQSALQGGGMPGESSFLVPHMTSEIIQGGPYLKPADVKRTVSVPYPRSLYIERIQRWKFA
jgi:hypothetical protein